MEEEVKEATLTEEKSVIEEILELVLSGNDEVIKEELQNYHYKDIANALEELSVADRIRLYRILGNDEISEIFTYLDDVSEYLQELGMEQAADVIEEMDADDAVDALEDIEDEETREQLISLMDPEATEDIRLITSYEDDEVGSMMTTNFVKFSKNASIREAMNSLVAQAGENDNIKTLYVVDEEERFYGAIELRKLIIARKNTKLEDIIVTGYPTINAKAQISESIEMFKSYAEDSIPVLDDDSKLIGVITPADVVEAVDDEMSEDYAKFAGLTEEAETDETLIQSMRKRLPWLILLLVLGLGVSTVVGLFENVVAEVAIIVSFQSMILGMAGNVGTQSLAVTIRVLMDERISGREKFLFVLKEIRVGAVNGMLLGSLSMVIVSLFLHFAQGNDMGFAIAVGGCVGIALLAAMIISSFMGSAIPIMFEKLKVDPAAASGPLITTINDLVAVVTYYGCAWLLLINILGF